MQRFKFDQFRANHPGVPVPKVRTLDAEETQALRARLAQCLGTGASDSGLYLVRAIAGRALPIADVDAINTEFSLSQLFWRIGIDPPDTLLLNWHRFDDVDEIRWHDLTTYFGDIWYPSSDDIDLLDKSCDWIVSIGDSGTVKVTRLACTSRQKIR